MTHRKIIFFLFVLITFFVSEVPAQSGRQKQNPRTPQISTPPQTTAQPASQISDEADGKIKSLIIGGEITHSFGYMSSNYLDTVFKEFTSWMKIEPRPFLNISTAGKMTLETAKERAKRETDNHVLWMGIAVKDDGQGKLIVTHVDYAVLLPRTGKSMMTTRVYPGKQTIVAQGGVMTIPSMSRHGSELTQMKQAARAVVGNLKNSSRL